MMFHGECVCGSHVCVCYFAAHFDRNSVSMHITCSGGAPWVCHCFSFLYILHVPFLTVCSYVCLGVNTRIPSTHSFFPYLQLILLTREARFWFSFLFFCSFLFLYLYCCCCRLAFWEFACIVVSSRVALTNFHTKQQYIFVDKISTHLHWRCFFSVLALKYTHTHTHKYIS